MPVRIFLVDDHQVVRAGVRSLLEATPDLVVVGEAGDIAQARVGVDATLPDVAVLDVRLPDGNGIELCREIRSAHPGIACLILTSFADDEALAHAVIAGAAGYVLKQIEGNQLVSAVRTAAGGQSLIDRETKERMLQELRRSIREEGGINRLTPREREILDRIASGMTNRQIGDDLFLAEKTVKNYVSNLLAKLGMDRRSEAAAYAARLAERRAQGTIGP